MRHSSLSSQIYKTSFLFAKSQIEEEFLVNRYLHMSIIAIKIFAHQNKKCATLHIKNQSNCQNCYFTKQILMG